MVIGVSYISLFPEKSRLTVVSAVMTSTLVGILPHGDAEINAISMSGVQPTAFATCDDCGVVTYWDSRMKKAAVLGVTLTGEGSAACDPDILDLVLDGVMMTVHTASSEGEIGIVDLRKGALRTLRVLEVSEQGGAGVATSGIGAMGFDAGLGQHSSVRGVGDASRGFSGAMGTASHLSMDGVLLVADEEGGIHALDAATVAPIQSVEDGAFTSLQTQGDSRTGKMLVSGLGKGSSLMGNYRGHCGSMCVGFTAALHATSADMGGVMGPLIWSVGMDGFLRTYGTAYERSALGQLYANDRMSVWRMGMLVAGSAVDPMPIVSSWNTPMASTDVGDNVAAGAMGTTQQRASICNPPVPGCLAPYFTQVPGDTPLIAVGRGDGTFAVLDCSDGFAARTNANSNELVGGATLAYLASGHERNALSSLLWSRPTGIAKDGALTTKWLTSVAYSGEVSTFDLTRHVLPLDADAPEGESDAPLVFAGNTRDKNQTGMCSSAGVNCAVAGGASLGEISFILSGTTHGEIIKVAMD